MHIIISISVHETSQLCSIIHDNVFVHVYITVCTEHQRQWHLKLAATAQSKSNSKHKIMQQLNNTLHVYMPCNITLTGADSGADKGRGTNRLSCRSQILLLVAAF